MCGSGKMEAKEPRSERRPSCSGRERCSEEVSR